MTPRGDPRRGAGSHRRREDQGLRRRDGDAPPDRAETPDSRAGSMVTAGEVEDAIEEALETVVEEEALVEDSGEESPARDALREQVLRLQAEFDNYRKRQAREFHRLCSQGKRDLVEELLVVLDNIDRAREHSDAGSPASEILPGLFQTAGQMTAILGKEGLEPMALEPMMPFDPNMHEAVVAEDLPEAEHDVVLEIFRRGYLFERELMRPALVKVGRAPHRPVAEPAPEEADQGA